MKSICAIVSALFLIAAPIGQINGFPSGAPTAACSTMTPSHGAETQPLTTSPFITELPDGYTSVMGNPVRLELRSKNSESSFKGFMIMAFDKEGVVINGTFGLVSDGKTLDCSGAVKNAATHNNKNEKKLVSLTWTPPADQMNEVIFKTTFVLEKTNFWVQTESKTLIIGLPTTSTTTTTTTTPPTTTTTAPTTKTPVVTTPSTASQSQSTWTSFIVVSLVAFLMRS